MEDDDKGGLLVLLFSIFSWCGSPHHLLFFCVATTPCLVFFYFLWIATPVPVTIDEVTLS